MKYLNNKVFVLIIVSLLMFSNAYSQQKCHNNFLVMTTQIVVEKDTSVCPLSTVVREDSIIANIPFLEHSDDIVYKILSKNCSWNNDLTLGKSIYSVEVLLNNKLAHPTIIFEGLNNKKRIIIQYEDGEIRTFE